MRSFILWGFGSDSRADSLRYCKANGISVGRITTKRGGYYELELEGTLEQERDLLRYIA